MSAVHEPEVAALLAELDVEVDTASSVSVRVTGPQLDEAEALVRRAARVSSWTVTREGSTVSVDNAAE
jgi:hypothetical protein